MQAAVPHNPAPATPTPSSSTTTVTATPSVFEFTKRKRWADLLITELSEAILFVLSPAGKVWYCGAAVTELLGWKDEDVVDRQFSDYVNQADLGLFQSTFQQCILQRGEILTYIRLRSKPTLPKLSSMSQDFQALANAPVNEVLFEVKGYPHFVVTGECKCFFLMAKPYPSRNTAILNTFLELKMENKRLEDRLMYLRSLAGEAGSTSQASTSSTSPVAPMNPYGVSTFQLGYSHYSHSGSGSILPISRPYPLPEPTSFYSGTYEELMPSPSTAAKFETMFSQRPPPPQQANSSGGGSISIGNGPGNAEEEEGSAKKKLKKTYAPEQYVCVTCGRTDSPEWRKGPTGPKTLCNACGLRWAKTVKTKKEAQAHAVAASDGPNVTAVAGEV
ncbi:blue light receptor [Cristinia sonorae]|uniref:Blue light receptor n=1 Tax=Cristinia sonorae TaxID=1940300 RepID=A0A8K0ULE5_9AGAR|nr:blue light receptor [Cristinia sonorae]